MHGGGDGSMCDRGTAAARGRRRSRLSRSQSCCSPSAVGWRQIPPSALFATGRAPVSAAESCAACQPPGPGELVHLDTPLHIIEDCTCRTCFLATCTCALCSLHLSVVPRSRQTTASRSSCLRQCHDALGEAAPCQADSATRPRGTTREDTADLPHAGSNF